MITFFTIPKAFRGHIGVIQHNALRSWAALPGIGRVLLLGNDEGTAEAAREHGFIHVPLVACNERGTPLLSDLFAQAPLWSNDRFFCYINADILVMSDFARAIEQVTHRKRRFLMVGQRTDCDITERIEFSSGWEDRLRERVTREGKLHRPTGIDYFVFNRDLWGSLPPFAVGRFSWDNWMIYRARQLQVPVIDASAVVTAIHQNHDYSHAVNGFRGARFGPEARQNLALAGGQRHLFTIWDSTHVLTAEGLTRRPVQAGLGGGIWSYRRSASQGRLV